MQNYTINPSTRVIEMPKAGSDVLGVYHDNMVDGAHFTIKGDIVSKLKNALEILINFILQPSDEVNSIPVTNIVKTEDKIEFDWILNRFATQKAGKISFTVCFKLQNDEEWNTTTATGRILEGIEPGETSPDEPPDETENIPDGRGEWY